MTLQILIASWRACETNEAQFRALRRSNADIALRDLLPWWWLNYERGGFPWPLEPRFRPAGRIT